MNDYILFMHDDAPHAAANARAADWSTYLAKLRESGRFEGGSAIGGGECANKSAAPTEISKRIVGYLRVRAENLAGARGFLSGNPVYEAGGTVEIRELPRG